MVRHDLRGAVVVITGASSGIGEATAQAFAKRGARLVLAARGREALEKVAKRCNEEGAGAIAVPTDVTDAEAVRRLAQKALDFGQRIDVWVSNVGVGAVGRFQDVPIEAHEQVVRSSLIGHMNDAHAVLPVFLRQRQGTFVNMISLGGFAAAPFAASYSAAKFGLRGFSEAIRAELAEHPDIHVCDIYPAFIDTPGIGHGANYTGAKLSAPPPVLDARRVAEAIVGVALKPHPTVPVGIVTNLVRLGHTVAPNLGARLMGRFMQSYFDRAGPMPASSGNLFGPPAIAGGIDGGLRSPRQREMAVAVGWGLTALAGLAIAARLARRRD